MVSHSLAIAKAALFATCIQPDPTHVPREQVNSFYELLDAALDCCSPQNIQRCTQWISSNILQSSKKASALAKYLLAVSGSLNENVQEIARGPHPRRTQLHILYLLNDTLHAAKYHKTSSSDQTFSTWSDSISKFLPELFGNAASHGQPKFPRHHGKLVQLLDLWGKQNYFGLPLMTVLQQVLRDPASSKDLAYTALSSTNDGTVSKDNRREPPFEMPFTHGDPSAPFYELPAAAMLPHIVPKSNVPIDPMRMKALQFKPGPADQRLVIAVKNFLRDADTIYGIETENNDGVAIQIDEIGQTVYQDKSTGEVISGESYYGWSKQFCERMKRPPSAASDRRSRGRDDSRSPHRRGYSSSRDRRRDDSSSRSPPRHHRRHSRSRSRSPYHSRSRSRSSPRRRSPSPPYPSGTERPHYGGPTHSNPQSSTPRRFQSQPIGQMRSPAPMPFPFPNGVPIGPDGLPIPPPRPPNWAGPWPPPPPPPPPAPGGGAAATFFPFSGFNPPPPPPPPFQ